MSRSDRTRRRTPGALVALLAVAGLLVAATAAPSGATDAAPELVTPPQVSRTVPPDLSPFVLDLDVQVRDDLWPAQPLG